MLAARSSGGGVGGPSAGHQPHHVHRKQSVASVSGSKAHRSNSQDAKRSSSAARQGSQLRSKAALIREMETNWYLKMFGLHKEDTVANKTGMPYRSVDSNDCVSMYSVCMSTYKAMLDVVYTEQRPHILWEVLVD
ncbi:voltage-gated potassium channel subunit beta-1a isoform X2 [Xyrichtys novacula]|uniref:Voltage-gated potassium channel subunit beta-1a isoform X2 n=1 Tax=Xyrichtys novacula TaxID=13765 RepID=A0AAV1FYH8_XYRNO|nr:voltage-gated potassium channel subunit beta-1a isoform X2 [Xyrichtys novacula]